MSLLHYHHFVCLDLNKLTISKLARIALIFKTDVFFDFEYNVMCLYILADCEKIWGRISASILWIFGRLYKWGGLVRWIMSYYLKWCNFFYVFVHHISCFLFNNRNWPFLILNMAMKWKIKSNFLTLTVPKNADQKSNNVKL